ncbi:Uncharacterised protein [BD1-7 clade bacterium]|uniref:Uncharacterized protein n=1 Tax=BD1-7 clade bacterium TaxID=2029982 RepID=A0A5S9PWE6_9GAMM|nr:Uncharacterised protein [BD1-7 clade bacterium]
MYRILANSHRRATSKTNLSLTRPTYWLAALVITGLLFSACSDQPVSDAPRGARTYPVLLQEGSLHTFNVIQFEENRQRPQDGVFILNTDNFTPARSPEPPPSNAPDQTTNHLGYSIDNWTDPSRQWLTNEAPFVGPVYSAFRPYRVLENANLRAPVNDRLNQPIYETQGGNVFEDQLATRFRWRLLSTSGGRIAGRPIRNYETLEIAGERVEILPDVPIWGRNGDFGSDARLYPAYRSVDKDIFVVESTTTGSGPTAFSLALTEFGFGETSLADALALFPEGGQRLTYRFTIDYLTNYTVYITFDAATQMASLFRVASGGEAIQVPYNVNNAGAFAEIDVTGLSDNQREEFGFQSYFNPIITGPFTRNGSGSDNPEDKGFYYGKRYLQTTQDNESDLIPIVLYNPQAHADLERTFQQWRISNVE